MFFLFKILNNLVISGNILPYSRFWLSKSKIKISNFTLSHLFIWLSERSSNEEVRDKEDEFENTHGTEDSTHAYFFVKSKATK